MADDEFDRLIADELDDPVARGRFLTLQRRAREAAGEKDDDVQGS